MTQREDHARGCEGRNYTCTCGYDEAKEATPLTWIEGVPPHPFDKEWFIALTTYGDRVVLTALPEEYTYDFKTADDTYIKADNIKRWMQFPDSSYIPFEAEATEGGAHEKGWRSMETAPKDGTLIDLWGINHLHYAKNCKRVVNVAWGPVRDWMGNERDDWQHGHGEDFETTHWMPLPAPPSKEGGSDAV